MRPGQSVDAGQPLFAVYSPDLIAAQREYIFVAQSHQTHRPDDKEEHACTLKMETSELTRLRNWDISDDQLQALEKSGKPPRTLTFRSPVSGVVIEKKAVQGMRFLAGEELYRVVNLSTIWVLADVFEQGFDLDHRAGQLRRRAVLREQGHLRGSALILIKTSMERHQAARWGSLISPKYKHVALHHPSAGHATALHHAPVAVLFAVFLTCF